MPLIATGTVVDSSDLYASKGWTTFKPQFKGAGTPPSLGSTGSATRIQAGRYIHIGNICDYQFTFQCGTGSTGDGVSFYNVTLPVKSAPLSGSTRGTVIGSGFLRTSTGNDNYTLTALDAAAASTILYLAVTDLTGTFVAANIPQTGWWGAGARLGGSVRYATT